MDQNPASKTFFSPDRKKTGSIPLALSRSRGTYPGPQTPHLGLPEVGWILKLRRALRIHILDFFSPLRSKPNASFNRVDVI
ncbi:hypothetical protein [Paraburkholderia sp. BCC1884]|uniref:hypothetical protein n=1 Tax=Paraburkholderia sp. BCC1884 TaxID=2562668 RepID=UPI001184052D|nr:hypothetical protein [Paraburkholderia sp. BCC1884]